VRVLIENCWKKFFDSRLRCFTRHSTPFGIISCVDHADNGACSLQQILVLVLLVAQPLLQQNG
jgi:hypothetical protein